MAKNKKNDSAQAVANDLNLSNAGLQGQAFTYDIRLADNLAQFVRERTPERVVHAKGGGAHGYFTATKDISKYTKAKVFTKGKKTEVFARFSVVTGERGSPDSVRDPRGFAVRFYTEEGNWDMVGNNTPVFFLRDPIKFIEFVHSEKRCPLTNLRSATAAWDYLSNIPEALHQLTVLFGDRGIPKSFRHMDGFSSHTFSFINADNKRFWVKFHFKTMQGIENLFDEEAAKLASMDPDYSIKDLFTAIEQKNYPKWRVCVQIMPEKEAEDYYVNPFDITKVWRFKDYPLIEIGILELNRNPDNYFAEVEQVAFAPSHVPPGIGFSLDKLLQARLFVYKHAQHYRIGTNFHLLPINCPHAKHVYEPSRDGQMRIGDNGGNAPNYQPNSFQKPIMGYHYDDPPLNIRTDSEFYERKSTNDDYVQAGALFNLMSSAEQKRLFANIARAMKGVDKAIIKRQLALFSKVDKRYGEGIAKLL